MKPTAGRQPEILTDVERGFASYERGAYFDAHEHFERAWTATPEPRSVELHALAQLAAAVHKHAAQNRADAAITIAGRAREKFAQIAVSAYGIDLVGVVASIDAWVSNGFRKAPPIVRATPA